MGVYYVCSRCNSTLQLSPGSRGFGQMRVPCFVCGGEARYAPSGPAPGAAVIQAPATAAPAGAVSALPGSGPPMGLGDGIPNPTVPMQTPDELLALDAHETAATVPVHGLTDADLARMLGYGQGHAQPGADSTVRTDSTPEIAAMLAAAQFPRHDSAGYTPEASWPAPPPRPAPQARPAPQHAPQSEPDIEEAIPTRAVAGLADRDIVAYASGLYHGLEGGDTAPASREPFAAGSGPAAQAAPPQRAAQRPQTPAPQPQPQPQPQAPAPQPQRQPQPQPQPQQVAPRGDEPTFEPRMSGSWQKEPDFSPSMFNQPGLAAEPGFGASGPQPKLRRDSNELLAPLGADRFTGEHPVVVRPRSNSNLGLWITLLVIGVLIVAVLGLGLFYVLKVRQNAAGSTSSPPAEAEDKGAEGAGE